MAQGVNLISYRHYLELASRVLEPETIRELKFCPSFDRRAYLILDRWALNEPHQARNYRITAADEPGSGSAAVKFEDNIRAITASGTICGHCWRPKRMPDTDESRLRSFRRQLNRRYDAFVKKFGFLNSSTNRAVFDADPESALRHTATISKPHLRPRICVSERGQLLAGVRRQEQDQYQRDKRDQK